MVMLTMGEGTTSTDLRRTISVWYANLKETGPGLSVMQGQEWTKSGDEWDSAWMWQGWKDEGDEGDEA